MGVTNWTILRMVVFQGLVVGVFGYCFGLGMAAGAENLMRMKMEEVVGLPPALVHGVASTTPADGGGGEFDQFWGRRC